VGHVIHTADIRAAYRILESPKGRDDLEILAIEKRMILKCILKKYCVIMWTVLIWLMIGSNDRLL
jgi:hypothetical protein